VLALPPIAHEQAYAHCHDIVAARAKNFIYAFMLLPPNRRRALEAIYAYCRLADDFADDEGLETAERARLLADLRARLRHTQPQAGDPAAPALAPEPATDLLMEALGHATRRYGVLRDDLDLVAKGCEQDLTVRRYETFQDLYDYCYMVASAVGLACLDVFGYRGSREEARARAIDLGLAMQLTNIIRDVREDWERDRVYFPQEDLARFGVSEQQIGEGRVDEPWRRFMAFQVARARDYFVRGRELIPLVRRRSRVCPVALAAIYSQLLEAVEEANYDVFTQRVSLSGRRKATLMAYSLGRGLLAPA
jgi:15-cis-phytoene synthase